MQRTTARVFGWWVARTGKDDSKSTTVESGGQFVTTPSTSTTRQSSATTSALGQSSVLRSTHEGEHLLLNTS